MPSDVSLHPPRNSHRLLRPRVALPLLLALAILSVSVAGWAARRLNCDICRKQIKGKYYSANGKDICQRCYSRYPHCPGCGLPVRSSSYHYKGKKVCSDCARRAGRCGNCNDVLLGKYYPVEGNRKVSGFCEKCVKRKSTCSLCGMPYRGMYSYGGKHVCSRCKATAKRCSTCSQPLLGTSFRILYQDGEFCTVCFKKRAHCDFCNRPILGSGNELPDGRKSCEACAATAVTEMPEALDLLAETVRFAERKFGMIVHRPYDFVLVDNDEMASLTGRTDDKRIGSQDVKELGLFSSHMTSQSPRLTIAILTNLPRTGFLETVSHEYAHLWQYQENPDFSDRALMEGFAQWSAAKWLRFKGLESALAKLRAREDPLYGKGYDRVALYDRKNGERAVIHYISTFGRTRTRAGSLLDTAQADPRPTTMAPLSEILSRHLLDGDYSFLRHAVPIDPDILRQRNTPASRVAVGQ